MEDKKETAPSRQKEQPRKDWGLSLISVVTTFNTVGLLILSIKQKLIIKIISEIIDVIDTVTRTLILQGDSIELIIDIFEKFT